MNLKPATLGRLNAVQSLFARNENQESESIRALFKDCFSHESRVDTPLQNKIIAGVSKEIEKLDVMFAQYGQEDSSPLFRAFFNAMIFELLWIKKPIAILWSEYKQLADLFFPDSLSNALKAILNQVDSEDKN